MHDHFFSVIILSAGHSTRMGFNKMLLKIGSKTVLERTVESFEECDFIDEIIIAAPEEDLDLYGDMVRERCFAKVTAVVPGGKTRQESVKNALNAISDEAEYIAVHDGARPLVKPETTAAVADAALTYGAAVAGVRSVDTLKEVDDDLMIKGTVDREACVQVRTPQIFKKEILLDAHAKAEKDGFLGTDECMLVERLGYPIKVVESGRENIKLTYQDDIAFITEVLRVRGKL